MAQHGAWQRNEQGSGSSPLVGSPITLSKRIYIFHCHILEHETAMMLNLKMV
jgi:hypothetical protein